MYFPLPWILLRQKLLLCGRWWTHNGKSGLVVANGASPGVPAGGAEARTAARLHAAAGWRVHTTGGGGPSASSAEAGQAAALPLRPPPVARPEVASSKT